MVILAREARGLTQSDLAEKLKSYKSNISRIEHGDVIADGELLVALSEATNFPPQFFMQKGEMLPVNLSYRKRKQVPAKILNPIEAQMNITRLHVQLITRSLEKPVPTLPVSEVSENNTPQKIAQMVRRKWNLQEPVICNITKVLEQNGVIICSFNFGTERVDSRSMLTDDQYPVIFINSSLPGDRQRFSLAFELAHLIMHTYKIVPHDRDVNHEANLFAAEFLMPAKEILKDFKNENITLPLLADLKRKWKQSMISLLYRADDLELLTANQKRYLIQQFNDQKIRRREPPELDVQSEKPQLMRQLITNMMNKHKLNINQICTLLAIEAPDYLEYYG